MSCAVGDCNPDRTQRHGNIPSHAWYHTNSGLTMYCKTMMRYVIRDEKAPQCFTKRQKQGEFAISSPGQTAKTKTTKGAPLFSVPKWALLCKQQTKQPNKTTFPPQADQTNDQANTSRTQPVSPLSTQRERSHKTVLFLTQSAVIAHCTLYLPWYPPLSACPSGVIQVRISEAMCICLLSHGCHSGTDHRLLYRQFAQRRGDFGRGIRWAGDPLGRCWGLFAGTRAAQNNPVKGVVLSLPNLVANTLIVPWVLYLVYQAEGTVPYFMLTVGAGELIAGTIWALHYLSRSPALGTNSPPNSLNKTNEPYSFPMSGTNHIEETCRWILCVQIIPSNIKHQTAGTASN